MASAVSPKYLAPEHLGSRFVSLLQVSFEESNKDFINRKFLSCLLFGGCWVMMLAPPRILACFRVPMFHSLSHPKPTAWGRG